jgi:hypothetical protein
MSRRAQWVYAFVLLSAKPAAAEGRPFRIAYQAPAECPAVDAMKSRIVASSARARLADPIEPAVDLGVSIVAESGGFMGYLRVRTVEGNETRRAVPAATCEEVVSALSLIAAIVVDPDAVLPPETPPEAPSPSATEAAPAPAATHEETRPALPAEPAEVVERHRPAPRYWFVVAGEVGALGAIAPDLAVDAAVSVGFIDTGPSLFAPSVRLSARGAWSPDSNFGSGEGTASFRRLGGRLSGCPLRVSAGPIGLRPCGFIELGSLHASSQSPVEPSSPTVLWGAAGVLGRGEMLLFDRLVLGLDLGALFPFWHSDFYYLPQRSVAHHQVDFAGFAGAFDIAVRFL